MKLNRESDGVYLNEGVQVHNLLNEILKRTFRASSGPNLIELEFRSTEELYLLALFYKIRQEIQNTFELEP